ncbi:MAG: outer membrane protein assembly factor BamD [Rhizobiaceae bacterium]|nr:outer membrane protein assembly factor BamD [Rhizobiaceae bacterium]
MSFLGTSKKLWMVLAVIAVAGCSGTDEKSGDFAVEDITPADALYNQALANLDAGDLRTAQKRITDLNRQHPYSEYSRRSLILDTFINYRQGKYTEATTAGKRFIQLYPSDKDAAYAQYIIGMSYFKQMPHITRDQSVAQQSYDAMASLVEKYPESEYVEDARAKMRITKDQLAGKQMLVGRYYQERREFLASINRFRRVVEEYPDTRHVEEALARLTESYFSLGLVEEAQNSAAVLGHNFPDSTWYSDSYALLQTGGVEPREAQNSWLSGLFIPAKKT